MELIEWKEAHAMRKEREVREARRRIQRRLWLIFRTQRGEAEGLSKPRVKLTVGAVETWVDAVHEGETDIVERVKHAIRCLVVYIKGVHRPERRAKDLVQKEAEKGRRESRARWAMLMNVYKQAKQSEVLKERAAAREGLICANTRNVWVD